MWKNKTGMKSRFNTHASWFWFAISGLSFCINSLLIQFCSSEYILDNVSNIDFFQRRHFMVYDEEGLRLLSGEEACAESGPVWHVGLNERTEWQFVPSGWMAMFSPLCVASKTTVKLSVKSFQHDNEISSEPMFMDNDKLSEISNEELDRLKDNLITELNHIDNSEKLGSRLEDALTRSIYSTSRWYTQNAVVVIFWMSFGIGASAWLRRMRKK